MSTLKLHLFGTPRLERDGEMLGIRRRKGLALLVYLARTGTPHSREALATLLWPDYDHSSALSNLRREMSRIKSDAELDAGEELFSADRHQMALEPELDLFVDTAEFEALMAAASAHDHVPDSVCPDCMERLTQAVELYTSDFLSGFTLPDAPAFDDWQFFEAESLRLLLSQALQQLFQWHTRQGAYEQAIGYARRWLALDPLHEPAQRELMALYARTGQQAAALRQYEECVRILEEELGVEPEEETTALYEAIRTRQFPPAAQAAARPTVRAAVPAEAPPVPPAAPLSALPAAEVEHRLPTFAGPFVGRAEELATLAQLFANRELRLITIVGLGGVGKTRLAVAAATAWIDAEGENGTPVPRDGIHFVPLAQVDGPDQLVPAVGNALNLSLRTGKAESQQQLLAFLSSKEYLLIMDNFEHLVSDETVALVRAMIAEAPGVRLLLTSRLRLNLQGEQLFPLAGLRVPPAGGIPSRDEIAGYDALEMFRQQAERIDPDFALAGANLKAAVQICQLVQGVPLGIELAAGWLELLPAAEIAAEIERSIDFLEAGAAEPAEHQQSLRAMFITSWHWLDSKEQEALKGLSVFQGGATREAAQAVTGASLPTLLSLANKSWIQRNETRYQMHELLRQYVRAELKKDPAAWEEGCQRHASYYADFLARQAAAMRGPGQREAYASVKEAFANIRLAWQWLVTHEEEERALTQMLPGLYRYCEAHLRAHDLLQLLNLMPATQDVQRRELLATVRSAFYRTGLPVRFETAGSVVPAEEEALRTAWALATQHDLFEELGFWGTILAYTYGRVIDRLPGVHHLRRLVAAFERQGETWEQAFALHMLAQLLQGEMDDQETEQYLHQSLGLFQKLGDERESGYVLRSLGQQCRLREAFADAIAYWKTAQEKLETAGDVTIAASIHWQMGDAYLQLGEFEQAFTHYRNMVDAHARLGRKRLVADTLSKASFEAVRYGDLDYARESREQALALAQDVGDLFNEGWSTWEMGELLRVRGDLTGAREWYEKALLLFTRFEDRTGYTFYHRGLGDIALARGNYLEAQLQFQASLRHAQATDNDWGLAYAWGGMGRASVGLEHVEMARQHFLEALHRARATGDRGITLLVLAGVTSLFVANGNSERAVELGTFVLAQPLTWREIRTWLQALLRVERHLPAEERVAAEKRALARELWPTVQELIDQFEAHVRGRDGRRLPAPAERLTGREQELADLRRLLLAEKELRVLTITGSPGSGRTHLALTTAARIRSAFRDDVLYVPTASLCGRAEIVEAIARHAGFPFISPEDGERQLLGFLQEQELLLVLDNLAVGEGAKLVEAIVQTAPQLRLLVTATQGLAIDGETIYRLHGLSFPDDESITLTDAVHYGAVALLLHEAEHSLANFGLDAAALPHVIRLVQQSEGQPLALRLLAARLQQPGPEALSQALAEQLTTLAKEQPELPVAERPLHAALAVTWQGLAPEMQRAFATLSVFERGFSRQAAEGVAHAGVPVLRTLAVGGYLGLDNRGRYTIHEAVRAFGNEQLKALGLEDEMREAHSAYFLTALRQRMAELQGLEQTESLGEIEADLDNIRAAWGYALARPDPDGIRRALESLFLFCRMRGRYPEGLALLARARDQLEPVAPEIAAQAHSWFEKLLAAADDTRGVTEGEHRQNLPLQATPFVGRQKELVDLRRLFTAEPDCRLVTVVGPGGIGKTRLAVEAARTALPAFPDGAYFVPLAPLTSPEQIIAAIGESVGFHFASAPAVKEQLLNYLEGRELLLVLDNFEHLMEGNSFVAELVMATRAVTILVTSRAALNLSGEMVYTIGGLSYPLDEPGRGIDVTAYASVQLLLQQARLVRPLFRPDEDDLRYAAKIARLVQGMPLAIVLAAHWLEMLSLEEIAHEIASSLDFLEAETQDVPERQRSVRAVFDYSWRQLPADARDAFLALSVFRGGFTRHAAQAVTGARLRTLRTLVNKSFLAVTPDGRYEIHELLRQYGEQQLEASGKAGTACAAHGEHYLHFLQEREAHLKGGRQAEALREIQAELKNVRAAWRWALQVKNRPAINGALESLHLFCDLRGQHQQGSALFGAAREQLAPGPGEEPDMVWGRIVTRHGFLQVLIPSDPEAVAAALEQGLAIAEAHNDTAEIAIATHALGVFAHQVTPDPAVALERQERALALFRELGEPFYLSRAHLSIGISYGYLAQPDQMAEYMRLGLEIARTHGNKADMALALSNLTEYAFGVGEYGTAESYCREALAIARELGIAPVEAYAQAWLGFAYLLRAKLPQARENLEESLSLAQEINSNTVLAYAEGLLALCTGLDGDYDRARSLAEASRANPTNNTIGLVLARWALAIAFYGLREDRAGREALQDALSEAVALTFPAPPLWLIPLAALHAARQGDAEEAAALLAMATSHSLARCGWIALWPPLAKLRDDLEEALGSDTFRAAWERGAERDVTATVTALLGRPDEAGQPARVDAEVAPPTPAYNRETTRLLSLLRHVTSESGPNALPAEAAELMPIAAELEARLARMEQMEQELALAREVQQRMLPHSFPKVPGYEFASRSTPARVVGGDFFDVIALDNGRFGLAIADVADKGMPAALFMALTRSLLLAEARRADSPRDVLHKVNDLLLQMGGGDMFVTLFYGVVDSDSRVLTYVRAGHDHPFLLRDGEAIILDSDGMVLGLFPAAELALAEEQLALAPGDRLVLYSDGLTDALTPEGESYDRERLQATLLRHAAQPAEAFCEAVFAELADFQRGALPFDDMTLLLVSVV